MNNRFLLLWLIALTLSVVYYFAEQKDIESDSGRLRIEREVIDDRVVRLLINSHACSGFVVAKDLIATAAHCVNVKDNKFYKTEVDYVGGRKAPFKFVAKGGLYAGADWALISSDTEAIESMPLSFVPVTPGMVVATIGHPFAVIEEIMTFGMVMKVDSMITIAMINYPGESGSPVIDQGGLVIGILSAVHVQTPVTYITPVTPLGKKIYELGYVP